MTDGPILSELLPPAGTPTVLYQTVTGQTAAGTIFCMNASNTNDYVSVALVPSGYPLYDASYIAYNTVIYHGQSLYLQQIYLNSLDTIYVSSQNGTSNFIFNGLADPTIV